MITSHAGRAMIDGKKYSFSVHTGVVDKPDEAARRVLGKGWESVEMSEADVAECVLQGWAIAPKFRGGRRKTSNFIRSGFLAADVDAGMTLDDAKEHAFVRHHAALIHTTASHTAQHHRFRIIFLLDEPIPDARDWADALMGIARKLGSDPSVTDGARMFFGNTKAEIFRIGGTVPAKVVADLIAAGRDARASRAPGGARLPVVSDRRFAGPELIKVAGGDMVRFDELDVGRRVHCPHHDDNDPSAFTMRFRDGHIGIHCSACKVSFGMNGRPDDYDFGAFDRLFEQLRQGQTDEDPDATGLDRFFPPAPRFEWHQEGFLPRLTYAPGITLVKSSKGSGKTDALKFMLDQIRAKRFLGDVLHKDQPKSVLLVGHRQSLLREAAAKLGLHCYLDGPEESDGPLRTLAVTLDSLPKFNESNGTKRKAYDLVIIDESEQVLSHLFGKTIEKGRGLVRCFDALQFEVANAKAVIALDADLGLVTTHALQAMRPQDWSSRCRIVYNAPIVPGQRRVMRLHSDVKHLERQMIEAIKRGERCFVVSNSKAYVQVAERMIRNQCGEDVAMRVVTSDNSRDPAILRFLGNIREEFLKVQVVMGTPSIGTGIDITFPNGECKVDRVFGFFQPFINTHMDIDQQLCRVRNPGMVDVWISPATFTFTCNPEIIMDDLGRAYVVSRAVKGRPRPDGMVEYDRNDPLLTICTHVTALQRASKNQLIKLFCELRRANGWDVELVHDVEPIRHLNAAKKMLEAERKEMLANAEPLDSDDYIDLDGKVQRGASLSNDERIRYERSHFEKTVGVPLDSELIEMNVDGGLLDRVKRFAGVLSIWSDPRQDLAEILLEPTLTPKGRLQKTKPERIIAVLIRATGLTTADKAEVWNPISLDGLSRFIDICRENRTVIEEVLGVVLRDDFAKKPIRQLNEFIRSAGLTLKVGKAKKESGRKVRPYAVPEKRLGTMMRLARSYLEAEKRREAAKELEPRRRQRVVATPSKDDATPARQADLLGILEQAGTDPPDRGQ